MQSIVYCKICENLFCVSENMLESRHDLIDSSS